ncbi:MAG: thiol:disulfide interchange protein DsbC [Cellvibrionaceae bacterium]|jgi:thiol:disulfide interchange protein DsbC
MKLMLSIYFISFVVGFSVLGESFFPSRSWADSASATASEIPSIEKLSKTIIPRLQAARPELSFSDLEVTPVKGLYKIKVNNQTAFVSSDGSHLISGEMYQVQPSGLVSLQERERQSEEVAFEPRRAKMLQAVPREDLLIYSPEGRAKGHVYIFTDIDCGFCRRLHSQMPEFLAKGIEVRYLAFPRAGKDSVSARKLASAWCAEDPKSTMTEFKSGKNVPLNDCENNPVADQYALGQQVGVRGTPAIILQSGKLIPGAVSPDYLAKEMGI